MIPKTLADGTTVTAFPIVSAQQLMFYFYLQYGKDSPVLNIGTGYYWQGDFDVEAMRESLKEAIQRCDTMRLRFTPDEKYRVLQYIVADSGIEIDELDYSDIPYEESYWIFKKRTRIVEPMFDCPLHQISIVHLPDNYHGFYLKLHHLAKDGYSAKVFIADVLGIYMHKVHGAPYPKPMRPYSEVLKKEFAYPNTERHEADKVFWANSVVPEPMFTDYLRKDRNRLLQQRIETGNPNLRYAGIQAGDPLAKTEIFEFPLEDSNKLFAMCKERELSLPCVLMMSVRTALSAFNDREEDVSMKVLINRRGTITEKKSGGVRMHIFAQRSIVPESCTFVEGTRIMEDAQNELYAHSNISTIEAIQIRQAIIKGHVPDCSYDSTSFSYHPIVEMPVTPEMKATSIGLWYNNDFSMQNFYITAMHRSNDRGLNFTFEYRVNVNPLEDLKIFYENMRRTLVLATENPDIKMGEILDQLQTE